MVSNSKRPKKGRSKISFDEEVISKEDAKILVSNSIESEGSKPDEELIQQTEKKVKRKRQKTSPEEASTPTDTKKKRKTNKPTKEDPSEPTTEDVDTAVAPKKPAKESNRSQKKKKHVKLLEQKKLKIELEMQQKSLNYLSKWKHSRSEWKFEKLRQVWLQQNLFDPSKIPDKFWETTVEYFSGAKGNSKQVVLDRAIQIIEQNKSEKSDDVIEDEEDEVTEDKEEEVVDDKHQLKVQRARDIVQNLE